MGRESNRSYPTPEVTGGVREPPPPAPPPKVGAGCRNTYYRSVLSLRTPCPHLWGRGWGWGLANPTGHFRRQVRAVAFSTQWEPPTSIQRRSARKPSSRRRASCDGSGSNITSARCALRAGASNSLSRQPCAESIRSRTSLANWSKREDTVNPYKARAVPAEIYGEYSVIGRGGGWRRGGGEVAARATTARRVGSAWASLVHSIAAPTRPAGARIAHRSGTETALFAATQTCSDTQRRRGLHTATSGCQRGRSANPNPQTGVAIRREHRGPPRGQRGGGPLEEPGRVARGHVDAAV